MRRIICAVVPLALLIAGCGGGEIVTTNTGNVVLNDAQANFASTNDNEGPIVNEMMEDNAAMNMAMPMDNGMASNAATAR